MKINYSLSISFSEIYPTIATLAILWLTILLWKTLYTYSDLAVLIFLPLLYILFLATFKIRKSQYIIEKRYKIKPISFLFKLLTGNLKSFLRASIFIVICYATLILQGLTISREILILLFLACIFSSVFTQYTAGHRFHHFQRAYSNLYAIFLGVMLTSLVFVPIIWWVNYTYSGNASLTCGIDQPNDILQHIAAAAKVMDCRIADVFSSDRRGFLAEVLAPFLAIDGMIYWLVDHSILAAIIFSLISAFICAVFSQMSIVLTLFWNNFRK